MDPPAAVDEAGPAAPGPSIPEPQPEPEPESASPPASQGEEEGLVTAATTTTTTTTTAPDPQDTTAATTTATTVEERWARLARLASLEGMRRALATLAQAYEAAAASKGSLAVRLEEDLADSEWQLEAAAAAHRRHVEELQGFHERRCAGLRDAWARDAGALKEEFEQERAALSRAHTEECEGLRAALIAMDAYERAQEEAAAQGQARLRGLAVARGREAVRALRRSLCGQLEALERQLEEQQQAQQQQHHPASAASATTTTTALAAVPAHRRRPSLQPLLPAPATTTIATAAPGGSGSQLASDVARLGQRDQAMVRQLERRVRKVEHYLGQLKEWRSRLTSTGREHSERNQALLVEKRALLDQCQKLKRHMNALREEQEAKLGALNQGAGAALDELQAKMELGLRILHLSELAERKEVQQDEILAMLELPAGADLGGGGQEEQEQEQAQEQQSEEAKEAGPAAQGEDGGWEADLAGFWARYNQALLSKLLLAGARDRLEAEHRHLQAVVKQYQNGTRVSDEVLAVQNPLLVVQGNLTDEPPPTSAPSARPNVIDGNHMVETGRVCTGRFM